MAEAKQVEEVSEEEVQEREVPEPKPSESGDINELERENGKEIEEEIEEGKSALLKRVEEISPGEIANMEEQILTLPSGAKIVGMVANLNWEPTDFRLRLHPPGQMGPRKLTLEELEEWAERPVETYEALKEAKDVIIEKLSEYRREHFL